MTKVVSSKNEQTNSAQRHIFCRGRWNFVYLKIILSFWGELGIRKKHGIFLFKNIYPLIHQKILS